MVDTHSHRVNYFKDPPILYGFEFHIAILGGLVIILHVILHY